jgi:hypothetical protein
MGLVSRNGLCRMFGETNGELQATLCYGVDGSVLVGCEGRPATDQSRPRPSALIPESRSPGPCERSNRRGVVPPTAALAEDTLAGRLCGGSTTGRRFRDNVWPEGAE